MRSGSDTEDPEAKSEETPFQKAVQHVGNVYPADAPTVPITTGRATEKSTCLAEVPEIPDLLDAAPDDTLRPVVFADIGACCGSNCKQCWGKGYVTYLRGKVRKQEVCVTGLRKFNAKHGHQTMEVKGIRVWLPPGSQTTQQGNPLRAAMQLRRQAKAGLPQERLASPPDEPGPRSP